MEAILHVGIAQFLFAAFLVLTKHPKQLADVVLGLWLALMTIFMGLTLLKNMYPDTIWGTLQLFPFSFSIGPFLFLYVRMLTVEKPVFRTNYWLHLLPFAVCSVLAVLLRHPVDEYTLNGNAFTGIVSLYSMAALVSFVGYSWQVIDIVARHQQNILNHFSYSSERVTLQWLKMVVIGFIATLVLTLLASMINVLMHDSVVNPGVFLFLGFCVFAYGLSYYGLWQTAIFEEKPATDHRFVDHISHEIEEELKAEEKAKQLPVINGLEPPPTSETVATNAPANISNVVTKQQSVVPPKSNRYSNSSLRPEDAKKYAQWLLDYMETEKPYLQRDLTIQMLAQSLNIPKHHLTQTINEQLHKNFYTLVNEYRVNEVKQRIIDPQYAHFTLLAIAHDAGFNSKSTFNNIFKKTIGLTPSAYRNKHFKENKS